MPAKYSTLRSSHLESCLLLFFKLFPAFVQLLHLHQLFIFSSSSLPVGVEQVLCCQRGAKGLSVFSWIYAKPAAS